MVTRGERAHSARAWMGTNAIHGAAEVLARLNAYEPRRPVIDGLEYHEGLNAVFVTGGVAGNVLPDLCTVSVNYRFAPTGPRRRRSPTCARSSTASSSRSATPPLRDARSRRARGGRLREAVGGEVNPKFGGPTWPGSARSASPR